MIFFKVSSNCYGHSLASRWQKGGPLPSVCMKLFEVLQKPPLFGLVDVGRLVQKLSHFCWVNFSLHDWYTMLYTNHTQKHALDQGHLRHCGVGHTGLVPRRTSHFRTLSRALCGETKRHQEVADSKSKKNWITQPYVARLSFLWTRINTHTN